MTVYAPVEHQPKLGRRRDELTEVRVLVYFSFVAFLMLLRLLSIFNIVHRLLCRSNSNLSIACHLERAYTKCVETDLFCLIANQDGG